MAHPNVDALFIHSWSTKAGNELDRFRIGSSDSVAIKDWYVDDYQHIEQFNSGDGKVLRDGQVNALVSALAPPAAGQTTLPANYQATLNPILATTWK